MDDEQTQSRAVQVSDRRVTDDPPLGGPLSAITARSFLGQRLLAERLAALGDLPPELRRQLTLLGDTDLVFTDRFRLSVKHFLEKLSIDRVTFAAERAYQKVRAPDPRLKYFCGICWKLIKEP